MINQHNLFYNTQPLSPTLFDDFEYDLNDNLLSTPLSPILFHGDLGDEVPILEFDLSDLEFNENFYENFDENFYENFDDDLSVLTPPSSPKSVFHAPKPISDIFDFFFYR